MFSNARLIWVNVSSQVKVETERGIYFYTSTVFQEYRESYMTTDLSNVSAIHPHDLEKTRPARSKKRNKQELRQVPQIERMLVNSGMHLFKFWFSVSRQEQLRRFHVRRHDPLKHWKLSPVDIESLNRREEYTSEKSSMFFYTDTADAP